MGTWKYRGLYRGPAVPDGQVSSACGHLLPNFPSFTILDLYSQVHTNWGVSELLPSCFEWGEISRQWGHIFWAGRNDSKCPSGHMTSVWPLIAYTTNICILAEWRLVTRLLSFTLIAWNILPAQHVFSPMLQIKVNMDYG